MKLDASWAIAQGVAGGLTGYLLFAFAIGESLSLFAVGNCVVVGVAIVVIARRLRSSR